MGAARKQSACFGKNSTHAGQVEWKVDKRVVGIKRIVVCGEWRVEMVKSGMGAVEAGCLGRRGLRRLSVFFQTP